MDGFVGRAAESAALQRWWDDGGPVAAVWGRRRVGKSALAGQIARGRQAIVHVGAGRGEVGELELLARRVAEVFPGGAGGPPPVRYGDWSEAFADIGSRRGDGPVLLVLDGLGELFTSGGLARALREHASYGLRTGLRVLLVNSRIRQMEALQRPGQPLHGVADPTVLLHPFTPREAGAVLHRLDPVDRARAYGLVGGMPLYLSWWDQEAGMAENLDRLALRPGARLLTEGDLLLDGDLDDAGFNSRVLHALADGCTSYNDVRDWAGTEPARPLDRLIEERLIERVQPVGESRQARRRRYRITDPFVRLYLGVLCPLRPEIDAGSGMGLAERVLAEADGLMEDLWVEAFRAHLRDLVARDEMPFEVDTEDVEVGPWWDNTGKAEIDVVVLKVSTGLPLLVGAARWDPDVDAARMVAGLRNRVERGLGAYPSHLRYAVCGPQTVSNASREVFTYKAQDLFGG